MEENILKDIPTEELEAELHELKVVGNYGSYEFYRVRIIEDELASRKGYN